MLSMPLLIVENLALKPDPRSEDPLREAFPGQVQVEDISFSIEPKKSLALVGEEGSGKGAIASALLFLRPISEGSVTIAEVEVTKLSDHQIRRLRKQVQGVFSDGFGQLTENFTVDEMFSEVLRFWYPKASVEEWHHRIEMVMVSCGLPEAVRHLYPSELDAVERQEVALARALLLEPDLLILHEFTSRMDAVQQAELLDRVRSVREEFGLTLLVFTDDLAVAHQLSDAIGVLHRGRLLELSLARELIDQPEHDYTKRLVSYSI